MQLIRAQPCPIWFVRARWLHHLVVSRWLFHRRDLLSTEGWCLVVFLGAALALLHIRFLGAGGKRRWKKARKESRPLELAERNALLRLGTANMEMTGVHMKLILLQLEAVAGPNADGVSCGYSLFAGGGNYIGLTGGRRACRTKLGGMSHRVSEHQILMKKHAEGSTKKQEERRRYNVLLRNGGGLVVLCFAIFMVPSSEGPRTEAAKICLCSPDANGAEYRHLSQSLRGCRSRARSRCSQSERSRAHRRRLAMLNDQWGLDVSYYDGLESKHERSVMRRFDSFMAGKVSRREKQSLLAASPQAVYEAALRLFVLAGKGTTRPIRTTSEAINLRHVEGRINNTNFANRNETLPAE